MSGWEDVEDRLAEWFGLDQSKYQWAVDELLERQLVSRYSRSFSLCINSCQIFKLEISVSIAGPNQTVYFLKCTNVF